MSREAQMEAYLSVFRLQKMDVCPESEDRRQNQCSVWQILLFVKFWHVLSNINISSRRTAGS